MFDTFMKDVSNFGLSDALELYQEATNEDDKSSSQVTTKQQSYEQLQQKATISNTVNTPIDKNLIYGGVALGGIVILALVLKGK